MQHFLSVRPIILKDGRSTRNIHNLVFADKSRRAPHVRALDIRIWDVGDIPPESRPLLVDHLLAILLCADNLESLDIPNFDAVAEFFSILDYRLLPALGRFTTLRNLFVGNCEDEQAVDFFRSIHSSLKVLRVDLFMAGSWHGLNRLATVTAPFAATLETLEVLDLDVSGLDDVGIVSPIPPHSALRSLIVDSLRGLPRLRDLLSVFPTLSDALVFKNLEAGAGVPVDLLHQVRDENKKTQETCSWKRLDYLSCEASVYFALALKCPIRHPNIHGCCTANKVYVTISLRENPPPQLTLSISSPEDFSVFHGLFPAGLAATLTHLSLFLRYKPDHGTLAGSAFQCKPLLDTLLPPIAHLRLRYLRLAINNSIYIYDNGGSTGSASPAALVQRHVCIVSELPSKNTASRLASSIPSLEYVFLAATCSATIYGTGKQPRWHTSKAFRISRFNDSDGDGGKDCEVTELSEECMGAMLAREDWRCLADEPVERSADTW